MFTKEEIAMFLATGGFVGRISPAPGTLGSLVGLPICFALSQMALSTALVLTCASIVLAIWSSHLAERTLGEADPGCIVIDEIAGMVVTLIGLPLNLLTVVVGFLLFRTLDILKPFPIGFIEKRFTGGSGIVLDDLAAGLAGNCIIRVALVLFPGVTE
jgi:phosphatidylglycerophosphatase A